MLLPKNNQRLMATRHRGVARRHYAPAWGGIMPLKSWKSNWKIIQNGSKSQWHPALTLPNNTAIDGEI
jgi:hypothetical protein